MGGRFPALCQGEVHSENCKSHCSGVKVAQGGKFAALCWGDVHAKSCKSQCNGGVKVALVEISREKCPEVEISREKCSEVEISRGKCSESDGKKRSQ